MSIKSDRVKGFLFVLISASLYATMPIIGKLMYASGLDASLALMMRFGIAFMALAFYLRIVKQESVVEPVHLVIVQGFLMAVVALMYFNGLNYLPAGMASVIFFTFPIFMAVLAVIVFREPVSLRLFFCILMALAGVSLISGVIGEATNISLKGVLLVLGASFCNAVFGILGQINLARSRPLSLTSTFALVSFVLICFIYPEKLMTLPSLTPNQWLMGAVLALVNTFLALTFYLKGIEKIGASTSGLVGTVEPAITVGLAALILGESLGVTQIIGILMILISIVLAIYRRPENA